MKFQYTPFIMTTDDIQQCKLEEMIWSNRVI